MSDVIARAGSWLLDPLGTVQRVSSCSFKSQVNVGCTWSAEVPYAIDLQQYSDAATWYLVFADPAGGTAWTSPPLAVTHGTTVAGRRTSLSGVDQWSMRLTSTDAAIPVFYDTDSWDIVTALGATVGVTILFNGACPRMTVEQFPAFEQNAKDAAGKAARDQAWPRLKLSTYPGQGETVGNLISRLLHDTGNEFRVNNAHVEVLPMGYQQALNHAPVLRDRVQTTVNRTNHFVQVVLAKTGNDQGTYVFDATAGGVRTDSFTGTGLAYPQATPVNVSGKAVYAKFLDNAGAVCGFQQYFSDIDHPLMTVPVTSSLAAVSVEWEVVAGTGTTFVRMRVDGTPAPGQIWIPHGSYTYGWTVTHPETMPIAQPRNQQKILTSPYWQSQDIADDIKASLLGQYSKERNGVSLPCILDPYATFGLPCYVVPADAGTPSTRIESIEMNDAPGSVGMTLSGYRTDKLEGA